VRSEPVRIPCEHRSVKLELKADGFDSWIPQAEPVPPEGGERKIIASLSRNMNLASLSVHFQDPEGEPVLFRDLKAVLEAPIHLDGKDIGARAYETGEALHFPALPAGRYRFGFTCPGWAPVAFEAEVLPGEKNEHSVGLSPAARLRLRFVAPEKLTVRFRILHEGKAMPAFPLKEDGTPMGGTGAVTSSGEEGALFGGLPPGSCTIEVTSDDLVATSGSVVLGAGETTELEMEVQKR
jgi:hypothetical protein